MVVGAKSNKKGVKSEKHEKAIKTKLKQTLILTFILSEDFVFHFLVSKIRHA
jgi:hypothetical protein